MRKNTERNQKSQYQDKREKKTYCKEQYGCKIDSIWKFKFENKGEKSENSNYQDRYDEDIRAFTHVFITIQDSKLQIENL